MKGGIACDPACASPVPRRMLYPADTAASPLQDETHHPSHPPCQSPLRPPSAWTSSTASWKPAGRAACCRCGPAAQSEVSRRPRPPCSRPPLRAARRWGPFSAAPRRADGGLLPKGTYLFLRAQLSAPALLSPPRASHPPTHPPPARAGATGDVLFQGPRIRMGLHWARKGTVVNRLHHVTRHRMFTGPGMQVGGGARAWEQPA